MRALALAVLRVTKAPWEAVTGENPSPFHDRDDASQLRWSPCPGSTPYASATRGA